MSCRERKRLTRVLIALLVSSSCGAAFGEECARVPGATGGADAAGAHRMTAKEVHLSNVASFDAQLRRDIPLGTKRVDVETYLEQLAVDFSYVAPHHAYSAGIPYVGVRAVFQASLTFWIMFDEDERVKEVTCRVYYL
jgi:hypothetical protein